MNQLAKAQLQQIQGPKQVNIIERVNLLVNKRRQSGQQVQSNQDQFDQGDSGYNQDDGYYEQREEALYANNYQGQYGNAPNQQWRLSGRYGKTSTSKQKGVVCDEVEVQNDDDPIVVEQVSEEKLDGEVRIDIQDIEGEPQNDVNPSREHVIDMPETVMPKAKAPLPRPIPPYPQRLAKQKSENQFKKFIEMMKSLSINVPLVEALEQIPIYAKFMKDLVTKKRSMDCEIIKMTHQVSAIVHLVDPKLEDPRAFTILCTIGSADFAKALCDLGASINLMPYSIFKTLGIGQPRATSMRLQMANRTKKRPLVDYEVPIILGRPFLATGKALVDVEAGELTFRVGDEKVVFHVCKSMRQPNSTEVDATLEVLQRRKREIGWTLPDIRG
ncbi:uncharacterized protein [Nicotiana sylvestris]|uniref:uncharacterized protein n=1 Tax=Nicotiana sylvestris TaxID=4096 RepID=UPI00388CA579